MFTIINNKKLISAKVSSTSNRFTKTVNIDGVYYEFFKTTDSMYPLELAFAQINGLKKYDIAFIGDADNQNILCIFLRNPLRKTIAIEKQYFDIHLNRYREIFNNIVIVNPSEIFENISSLENVDFIAIEKLPELIDPNKKKAILKSYFFGFFFIVFAVLFADIKTNSHIEELNNLKQQLAIESNIFNEQSSKARTQILPALPSKDVQTQLLKQFITQIDNGGLK